MVNDFIKTKNKRFPFWVIITLKKVNLIMTLDDDPSGGNRLFLVFIKSFTTF